MLIKIIIGIFIFIIIRDILAALLGWGGDGEGSVSEFFSDVKHNRAIERQWRKDGCPFVSTTIGWRPDPHCKEDGYKFNGVDDWGTPSYSKLIRGGTKEYREKFARDVEASKRV